MESSAYLREAIKYIPHILTLVDCNPVSPTYGCFDRGYWHYKTADFPSGMYQENVLPLALIYSIGYPGSPYFANPVIKNIVLAGIEFASRSAHRDGSCDDYYPNEKALGATVFSLLAMTEAYQILKLDDPGMEAFFRKRARWLMNHNETGKLSNHQALTALALYNVFLISKDKKFLEASRERLKILLSWQNPEGWFQEYEGADPGYQTVSIDALARYWRKSQDDEILGPVKKALQFALYFLHPDGSFGGEYGSRNTFIAYPAGMEILSSIFPEASFLASGFAKSLIDGTRLFLDDDRVVGHLVSNYLLAHKYFQPHKKPRTELDLELTKLFPKAGFLIQRGNQFHCVISLNKGGTCKIFRSEKLVLSNTGPVIVLDDGTVGSTNSITDTVYNLEDNQLSIEGYFTKVTREYVSPVKQILFRTATLTLGRSFSGSQLIRKVLQRRLILSKKKLPFRYKRLFRFEDDRILITDSIRKNTGARVRSLLESSNIATIYVAQSNAFQMDTLIGWTVHDREKDNLNRTGEAKIELCIK